MIVEKKKKKKGVAPLFADRIKATGERKPTPIPTTAQKEAFKGDKITIKPIGAGIEESRDITPGVVTPGERFEIRKEVGERGMVPVEQREREREGVEFLKEKGIFEEELPERVELDLPERKGWEAIPAAGPGIGVLKDISNRRALGRMDERMIEGLPVNKEMFGLLKNSELEPLIQNPQTARELALQEIQKEVIKQGTTASENFGAFVEGIPLVGKAAASWTKTIETPGENVETILSELDSERERASVLAEKAFTGKLGDPSIAIEQIEKIEENVIKLETRIQVLSRESASLRANSDQINKIEEKILRTKERIFIAKQAAAGGIIAPATDSNIFLTLKNLRGNKS